MTARRVRRTPLLCGTCGAPDPDCFSYDLHTGAVLCETCEDAR